MSFRITEVGLLATIQDRGRYGQYRLGITEGGPLVGSAFRLAQTLVGNPPSHAAVEIVGGRLRLRALSNHSVAVTGAAKVIAINGASVAANTCLRIAAGATLDIAAPSDGMVSYLAIAGGIDSPVVLGSRSTVVRERLGGLDGGALRAGQQLPCPSVKAAPPLKTLCRASPQQRHTTPTLRFIPGFQWPLLPMSARQQILSQVFTLSTRRDRMGCVLKGAIIETDINQLYSEATCLGAIQIPPNGEPIVLLNDRQTVGGYPKAGALLSVDCERLVQLPSGTNIRFATITPDEANRVLWLSDNYWREQHFATKTEPGS